VWWQSIQAGNSNPVSSLGALRHSLHLVHAAYVFSREGAFVDVDPLLLPPFARLPLAVANLIAKKNVEGLTGLSRAIDRLGPSYVKMGQFLATRPDIVGTAVALELERLQDRVTPMSRQSAVEIIEAAFGAKIASLYEHFGEPVAAASIAQVHRALVRTDQGSRAVAVKVLRAGIERRFARDLADMFFAARLVDRLAPEMRRLRVVQVVETLARSVRMEMDFRLEAAAASEFAENSRNDVEIRVPSIDWDLTTREVMTMEWIDGTPLADPQRLTGLGFDPPALAKTLIQTFLRSALRDGFFHADLHQGNLFVDPSGRIVVVDFGIMGRLGREQRRFLAEILFGFIRRDYRRVAEVHFEAGYVTPTYRVEDFAQAIRAIGEPIHSRTADRISMAKLLTLLFDITSLFDMQTRVELVMLQKTMVVVEGVARKLDPQLNMWSTSEPVVSAWIANNLGPVGRIDDLTRTFSATAAFLAEAPRRLDKLVTALEAMTARPDTRKKSKSRPSAITYIVMGFLLALAVLAIAHRLN
jgi:ubiquinone biosynthesis protein